MTAKHNIIEKLYLSSGFNDCLSKMEPDYWREDLKAEVLIILLTKIDDDTIIKADREGQMNLLAARVIVNQIQSNTSPFAKLYRRKMVPFIETHKMDLVEHLTGDPEYLIKTPIDFIHARQPVEDFCNETLAERKQREELEDELSRLTNEEIDKLYWYDKEMILAYKKYGSYRKIEQATMIPYTSCYCTIKKAMNTIKRNIKLCQ